MAHGDFAAESGGYDPDEIITISQDTNGHSTNLRVHVPTTWRAMMEPIIQSDQWPEYGSVQAIFRDALYHRLHWISEQKVRTQFPEVARAVVRDRYRKRLEADVALEAEAREFRQTIDRTLSEMLQREEYEAVQSLAEDMLEDIDSFRGPEQEKLTNQLHTYLERAKGRW